MEEYLKYGANDYYPPLPNGHRLFLHDIRRVAVRAAVAMGEQGDVVVSFLQGLCYQEAKHANYVTVVVSPSRKR